MARKWSYWTKNKLQILEDYVPAFNRASERSKERIYLDLMAGQPENEERFTGAKIAGSPRRVLSSQPGFTRHLFFELPRNAERLQTVLTADFPGKLFEVIAGDSNVEIDAALASLSPFRWAPTFAFIDQQAAEVWWETLAKISRFKGPQAKTKPELWLLMSPTMVAKGVSIRGTNSSEFRERVTRLYGTRNWLNCQDAREGGTITADRYRDEMTNLMRFRLEKDLGYEFTQRIPMKMENGTTIYDMIFASDHYVGEKIMSHLYKNAAEREPAMQREARRLAKIQREEKTGTEGLFPIPAESEPDVSGAILWQPQPCWNPTQATWWTDRD
ncbi:three-Cys-motif partner protein TcmP [Nocardia fluminea]|uniref:Three-Cys-motif partner protein n=1 Tax=Nocardia fluminea TaxID=134984 RepID=A0A2N3WYN8_9NOCA|nr:three-Cys-motif partner protein TcmP [Nocardia fluminea]PKV98975.1 three-Cys-motif partner protein [Nocardia fluminea]